MTASDPKRTFAAAQKSQILPCITLANSALSATLSSSGQHDLFCASSRNGKRSGPGYIVDMWLFVQH
jgi:hypothetical protein